MASLGTLAAELKLEGAAEMMAGLRGAGGAVSSLGSALAGARGPLAQFGGALRGVRSAGTDRLPAFALPGALKEGAARLPMVGRAPRLPDTAPSPAGGAPALETATALRGESGRREGGGLQTGLTQFRQAAESLRTHLGDRPRHDHGNGSGTGARHGLDGGVDFARGLRGVLGQLQAGLRGGRGEASDHGGAEASAGGPGIRLDNSARATGEGDRLARVGGFIGGGGGPALDYHRRTASATEKSAQNLQTLVQRWAGTNTAAPAAVWA